MKKALLALPLVLFLCFAGGCWIVGTAVDDASTFKEPVIDNQREALRLSPVEVSNATVRAETGSTVDAMRLSAHYGIVCKDRDSQVRFLALAASNGCAEAAYDLGQLYSDDPRILDYEKAKHWYAMAAKLGYEGARAKLDGLE